MAVNPELLTKFPVKRRISLKDAYIYCKNLTRTRAKNFYTAFLFLPKEKRLAIYAVYAFCRYSDDLADDESIKNRAELFAQWRRALNRCYNGEVEGPILTALQDVVRKFKIPKLYFDELIKGMEMDLSITRYDTFDDLYQYAYRAASIVGLISIEIFGYKNKRTREYAKNLGIALQLTNIMRDIKEDAERGRIYLPREDLERFKVSEKDLFDGRYLPSFIRLMEYEAARAIYYYERATELIPPEDRGLLATAEIMKNIYFRILQEMAKAGYDVFKTDPRISKLQKIWIALRTWFKIKLGGK
ncbi:all-trans-phytoene synthase [bacterium BMS3Abin05]|nr:all-trans-phytoene synthase [bacterium BMS3Abin05]GBE27845.1 all-trans-phytoene synthase [bacterium BMS3Bbin03]HDZ13121.1 squalene synthase HpnD [Bacteroidota bacterium]